MSRVGKKPIHIPSGVTVDLNGKTLKVKGTKGELTLTVHDHVTLQVENNVISVTVLDGENVKDRALWGLTNRLVSNLITGVSKGFSKQLEINGIGYKASATPAVLKLDVGFSHEVDFSIPKGLTIAVDKNIITISGADKQQVGEIAAQIRRIRKPEPYKGKGIKYVEEVIRRKAGKSAKAGSAA